MPIDAVIFDWGGTLAYYAEVELEDMWRLAARHIAPDREAEVTAQLTAVEVAYWSRTERGPNVNATTPVRDADMGGSPTFHDNRVEVTLVAAIAAASREPEVAAAGD